MNATDDLAASPDRLAGALTDYLRAQLPDRRDVSVSDIRPIPGGLSQQMYFFTLRQTDTGGGTVDRRLVLRRDPPPGEGVLDTHRGDEALVMRTVHEAGIPAPDVPWFQADPPYALGRSFLIMDRLPGAMMRDVPSAEAGSPKFQAIGRQMATLLGRIHALDPAHIAEQTGLRPPPDPGPTGAAAAQLDRHAAVLRRDLLEPQPALTDVILWLRRRLPAARSLALIHADYRLSNLLIEDDRITGILDWELAHLGDPMEDLGRLISRDQPLVSGLLPREEFIAIYEETSGITVDLDACFFWEVMARLRATITMLTGVRAYPAGGFRHLHLGFMGLSHANRVYDLLGLID